MGKLKMGILGGFSGTVGTVVGSSNRKGDDIIRAKSKKTRPEGTVNQKRQQSKFGLVTGFVQGLSPVIKTGLKLVAAAETISSHNYACRHILNNGITGTDENPEIDYSKVILSDGKLSRIAGSTAVFENGKVKFSWSDETGSSVGEPADKVGMVVYNAENGELSFSMGETARSAKTALLALPFSETGNKLLCYIFYQSATEPLVFSTSQYLGSLIAE